MEKLHIALVGGQSMPVFVGIRESDAGKYILIHSRESKAVGERIANYVKEIKNVDAELVAYPPTNFAEAKNLTDALLDKYKDWDVEANISSGTKLWSIAFSMLSFEYPKLKLICVDQNCLISDLVNLESHMAAPFEGGIKQILEFNMTGTESYSSLDSYSEKDLEILPEIKRLRSRYHNEFNSLTIPNKSNRNRFSNNIKDKIEGADYVSYIEWDRKNNGQQHIHLVLNNRWNSDDVTFDSPHAFDMVTSSGWFEYEVAKILESWPKAREVWMNVVFPYKNNLPKNEIDVIINSGYKLLFVECKTQIFDNTDIDKFSSAVKAYGGLGSKAIFITMEPMKPEAVEKCQTNGIEYYSTLDGRRCPCGKKRLFEKLNSMIANTNTR